ncbi:MAG: hypothetical protein Q8S26_17875 [Azonexus sp.]|nr:hypothetical protein [Azonexus sp.]
MCGYRCATDGSFQANRLCPDWRLGLCILFSLFGHVAIAVLLSANGTTSFIGGGGEPASATLLQVKLNPIFAGPDPRVSNTSPADRVWRGRPFAEKQEVRSVFPEVAQDQLPEPLSDIDLSVDDPRIAGFMILYLQIDRSGTVVASEVMYSNLPSDVRDKVVLGFSSMRFKPGRKGGEPDDASVLLRIDVD